MTSSRYMLLVRSDTTVVWPLLARSRVRSGVYEMLSAPYNGFETRTLVLMSIGDCALPAHSGAIWNHLEGPSSVVELSEYPHVVVMFTGGERGGSRRWVSDRPAGQERGRSHSRPRRAPKKSTTIP